jgi:hypothetical protein
MGSDKLLSNVNATGFPLQIKVANLISDTSDKHDWKVIYQEYSWRNEYAEQSGFIDIVIEDINRTSLMVLECKRVQDTAWTFLVPQNQKANRLLVKSWIKPINQFKKPGWFDIEATPETYESAFCVVPGEKRRSSPMVEDIASKCAASTEALGMEDIELNNDPDLLRIFYNVIVTTARLNVCRYNVDNINLKDGILENADFEEVPYIRFRKQFSTDLHYYHMDDRSGDSISKSKENTVFIVNSDSLIEFLTAFIPGDTMLKMLGVV